MFLTNTSQQLSPIVQFDFDKIEELKLTLNLKKIKIGDKTWRVQRVHVHGPKEGQAHSLCEIPDETKTHHE